MTASLAAAGQSASGGFAPTCAMSEIPMGGLTFEEPLFNPAGDIRERAVLQRPPESDRQHRHLLARVIRPRVIGIVPMIGS